MNKIHHYELTTEWTGNTGTGTSSYRAYERSVTISVRGKADIAASSDTAFNADRSKHNPEELLLAAISSCHLLWYLHLCAEAGVAVVRYTDLATGTMAEEPDGGGRFTAVILKPQVVVSGETMMAKAKDLHEKANKLCYIANSCNFPILHEPVITVHRS